jgi:gamma-glutamylcysteine synthetase
MESALSESTALSQKSEREYITLRDSIKGMTETWKQDTERLREEMRKREEKLQAEAQRLGKMYSDLAKEIQKSNEGKQTVKKLEEQDQKLSGDVEKYWAEQIQFMKQEVEKEARNSEQANKTAEYVWVSSELDLTSVY